MIRRLVFPVLLGLVGAGILIGLGVWQVQRLAWKEALLAEIGAQITAPPVALPAHPAPKVDKYLSVTVKGRVSGPELHVLTSRKDEGAGYRIIVPMVTDGGRHILLDEGFLPAAQVSAPRPEVAEVTVAGNVHWPDESDYFTPEPDLKANIWFARDLPAMAKLLGTEPTLVVARRIDGLKTPIQPMPVDTAGIPNDHLTYAITWFSLAAVWLGMTALLLWRITRRKE